MTTGATYVLPIRREHSEGIIGLAGYLHGLPEEVEVVVVDGSPPRAFEVHAAQLKPSSGTGRPVVHVPPDPDLLTPNGKVGGVLTGVRRASHERIVIADEDVRYEALSLARVILALDTAHVVRPQNYFDPLPWHARWDTARSLLNRLAGGDWPGTLGVRRSALLATRGYEGDVMFENFELVRTVRAAGGSETVPLDLFVRRSPPTVRQFWSQRIRQAYDELARPLRLISFLAVLPLAGVLAVRGRRSALVTCLVALVGLAEAGRRRGDGRTVFPPTTALFAPAWVAERAACVWLAVGARLLLGGIPYRGSVLRHAATPMRRLRRRVGHLRLAQADTPELAMARETFRSRAEARA